MFDAIFFLQFYSERRAYVTRGAQILSVVSTMDPQVPSTSALVGGWEAKTGRKACNRNGNGVLSLAYRAAKTISLN
eukprot:10341620-Heterocapsa_arctica.AAC.1